MLENHIANFAGLRTKAYVDLIGLSSFLINDARKASKKEVVAWIKEAKAFREYMSNELKDIITAAGKELIKDAQKRENSR